MTEGPLSRTISRSRRRILLRSTALPVERNRIRRRLREIVRLTGPSVMKAGHDYVLIGRRDALTLPFSRLTAEFARALNRVHAGSKAART